MGIQLSRQAKEILGKSEEVVATENLLIFNDLKINETTKKNSDMVSKMGMVKR